MDNTNKHVICLALITCTSRMIHSHFIVIQCFLPCSINSRAASITAGIVVNILHYAAFRTIWWDCCDFITTWFSTLITSTLVYHETNWNIIQCGIQFACFFPVQYFESFPFLLVGTVLFFPTFTSSFFFSSLSVLQVNLHSFDLRRSWRRFCDGTNRGACVRRRSYSGGRSFASSIHELR